MANIEKNKQGYGYKYTELAQINDYLESVGIKYYQYIQTEGGADYIYTVPIVDGKELTPRRGCRVVETSLSGKVNAAQLQGASITYARRYSLLLAFGLATEDGDAEALSGTRITEDQAKSLKQVMTARNVNVEKTLELYKVNSIEELTDTQYADILQKLNKERK